MAVIYHGGQLHWWRKPEYPEKTNTKNCPLFRQMLEYNIATKKIIIFVN